MNDDGAHQRELELELEWRIHEALTAASDRALTTDEINLLAYASGVQINTQRRLSNGRY